MKAYKNNLPKIKDVDICALCNLGIRLRNDFCCVNLKKNELLSFAYIRPKLMIDFLGRNLLSAKGGI